MLKGLWLKVQLGGRDLSAWVENWKRNIQDPLDFHISLDIVGCQIQKLQVVARNPIESEGNVDLNRDRCLTYDCGAGDRKCLKYCSNSWNDTGFGRSECIAVCSLTGDVRKLVPILSRLSSQKGDGM